MTGDGGWCIHGVSYGPTWRCGRCQPGVDTTNFSTLLETVPVFTEDDKKELFRKLNRIISLLERISGVAR